MPSLDEINALGKELEQCYCLRNAAIAVKLVNRDEVPESYEQPAKSGKHFALCQAFSFVRRSRHSLVMFAEDHWCLWPIINFRQRTITPEEERSLGSSYFIKDPDVSYAHFHAEYPYIKEELAKDGMLIAPLEKCDFEPDAVMIYADPFQLRQLLMAAKYHTGNIVQSSFDTCDSCGAALVPVINGEKLYNVSMPDAGEYERGLAGESELIFTFAGSELPRLMQSTRDLNEWGFGYKQLTYDLKLDYLRPKFYNDMFEKWGLATCDEQWVPGQR